MIKLEGRGRFYVDRRGPVILIMESFGRLEIAMMGC